MDLGIQGKVALVTGSSRGLGRAVARELAGEGAKVAISARTPGDLEETRRKLAQETNASILAIPADLSRADSIAELVDQTQSQLGPIEILVTNAGGPPPGKFETLSPEDWQAAARLTLESVVTLCRLVLPNMRRAGWGRILNVTSIAVKEPVENLMLSNALRAAVTGFARTLANEVAADGITVNNLLPGYTKTDRLEHLAKNIAQSEDISEEAAVRRWTQQIPMARLGTPKEFAALAAFLASERASYITGTSIPVDGGCIRSLL